MDPSPAAEFRRRSTLGVAVSALVLLTPFAINNLVQGRYLLGAGSIVIIIVLGTSAASTAGGRHLPLLTELGLIPLLLVFLLFSLRSQGIIGALWCYPAVISFYFILPERTAKLANGLLVAAVVPMAWAVLPGPVAVRVAATLGAVSLFAAIFIRIITRQQQELHAQATTDPLTGLPNRNTLTATLQLAIEQRRRTGTPMTLLTIDLDHFKEINDTLGHEAGDILLTNLGELFKRRIRLADRAFRLGGEEFLVLLYNTDAEGGRRAAEDLRAAIGAIQVLPGRRITASVGAATLHDDEDADSWMRRSDDAMYLAKAAGRDRVTG